MNKIELDNLKTKIKANFRIVETDKFYIQEKSPFGWSYDVKKDYDKLPIWFHSLMIMFSFGVFITFVALIALFITWNFLFFIISGLSTILIMFLVIFFSTKEKDFTFDYTDIRNAEKKVDDLVDKIIDREIKKSKMKNKKYHYFYTPKQLRKEKLNKINKT